jgi:hypothetical protein
MADAILMAGGTGGVSSDDVTAGKAQVLQGYKTVTTDSDDEIIEGTMVNRGNGMDTVEFLDAYWESKYVARMEQGFYAQVDQWKPYVAIPYAVLANGIHIDASKMLDTLTVAGVRGTIPVKGYHGPDSSEMWLYPQEGGYVVRIEEGYYHKGGEYKPYIIAPTALVKSAVNYHPEKTLSDTTTCNEQGQVKMVNTQDSNYRINKSAAFGIDNWSDVNNPVLYIDLPHGNAYYSRNDGHPHVCIDANNLGTAQADSVLEWQTATSQYGVKFAGTIPRWIASHGDVIIANSSHSGQGFAYDLPNVGRCIVVGIKNGAFIQGANYVALPSPNLQPWNVRQNVNVNGVVGTMVDYGAGGSVFNGATFDGRLASGVANKGFILRGIGRYLNLKNSSNGYKGIVDGGLKLTNGYGYSTSFKSAPDVGFVLSRSINLTPFRQLKVGFKFLIFRGDGTSSQPARVTLEVGVTPISQAGGESYSNESDTILKDMGQRSNEILYWMTSTRVGAGNQSDQAQQYLTLDVSASQGHHFVYIMLGNIEHEYANGSVYAEVIINHIELIN